MFRLLVSFALLALLARPALAADPSDAYLLGSQDQIEVNIASFPDLKTVTRVAADGAVTLPLVGQVKVGGLSLAAATAAIERSYAAGGYVKSPTVRVEIVDYQSRKASVLGQVNAQGLIALDRPYSVAEIIARAGGLAADAADTATIVRQKPGGGTERIEVDLKELTAGTGASTNALMQVRAGDVVYVPRPPTFSVIGAVNRPGNYRLSTGMTVQQALATAGDISAIGSKSGFKVRRQLAGATASTLVPVELDDRLLPGDILIVRERIF